MTPAERRQLENAYDRLYQLYDEGTLRSAELDEMYRIYDQLGPVWEEEASREQAETAPTIQAREPSVVEDVSDWLARNVYQPLGFSERSSYGEGRKLAGLMEFVPGPGTAMAGAQIPRDIRSGDYGMAAINAATVPLDLLAAGPARRAAAGLLDADGRAAAVRGIFDRLNQPGPVPTMGSNFGNLPPLSNAQRTQIAGTLPTYRKAVDILGTSGPGLDYGAGLGLGARELGFDAFEPFPRAGFIPTYTDPSSIPSQAYDRLTNFNVLNVVPRDVRDDIVSDIGRVIAPGGRGLITTRGRDVLSAQGTPGPEPMSLITSRDTYQKGFTQSELQDYLRYILGSEFEVEPLRLGPAGAQIRKVR